MSKKSVEKEEKERARREEPPPLDWTTIERVLALGVFRIIYLWGPPGLGKTHVAYRVGVEEPPPSITMTQDTPAAELRGHFAPVEDRFVWRDGPVIEAMRAGRRLVLNEISHAPPEVLALLHPVLESAETARLTLPTGETVTPAAGFHVIITDNHPPEELPEALRDRFDAVIPIAAPHPAALGRLHPRLRTPAERTFALPSDRRVSLRKWIQIDKAMETFDLDTACRLVLGPERGVQVRDAIRLAEGELRFDADDEGGGGDA